MIYPFRDRPDVGVEVLWYPVPEDTPPVPFPHIFPLRAWDIRGQEEEPDLGTRYDKVIPYTGPLPVHQVGEVCGTEDQWLNGISYADYLAGAYSCDCPELPMSIYVATLGSTDGSLTAAPASGNVVIQINPAHSNHWTKPQYFCDPDPAAPKILVCYASGQTAAVVQVTNDVGQVIAGVYPPPEAGDSLALVLRTPANTAGVTLSGMTFTMRNNVDGRTVEVLNDAVACTVSAFALWLLPLNAFGGLYGGWIVGTGIDTSYLGSIDADWTVYSAVSIRTYAETMVGDQGAGPELLKATWKDGYSAQMNGIMVGEMSKAPKARFHAKMTATFYGFQADQDPGGAAGVDAYALYDKAGVFLWGVGDDGFMKTSLVTSPTGTGTIIGRLEIRDQAGALIGYLPIYDTL